MLPRSSSIVRGALGGQGLFGYLVSEEFTDNPKAPVSVRGREPPFSFTIIWASIAAEAWSTQPLLALLAVPLWWRSRAARFCLVFCAVAWFFMASTRDAGASIHHTVLLWPFPQLFVAVAISSIRWNWLAASISLLLVVMNLLVLNQYILQFERNGAEGPFTDAIYPLSAVFLIFQARRFTCSIGEFSFHLTSFTTAACI